MITKILIPLTLLMAANASLLSIAPGPVDPQPAYKILENVTNRNKEPFVEGFEGCAFIRRYTAEYGMKWAGGNVIFYKVVRCLDKNLQPMEGFEDKIEFSKNGEQGTWHPLGKGCPPPFIEERPKNPCENGMAVSQRFVKEISRIYTAKIADSHHAPDVAGLNPEESGGVVKLTKELGDLQVQLKQALENQVMNRMKNTKPKTVHTDPQGNTVADFEYENGARARKTWVNGHLEMVEMWYPDNGPKVTDVYTPGYSTLKRTMTDASGKELISEHQITRNFDAGTEEDKVVFPTQPNSQNEMPITRDIPLDAPRMGRTPAPTQQDSDDQIAENANLDLSAPVLFQLPEKTWEQYSSAARLFESIVSKYVEENTECLLNRIIKQHADYLTFVCADSGMKSIKDVLFAEFGNHEICEALGDGECERMSDHLFDMMQDRINLGQNQEGVKVTSGLYNHRNVEASH